MASNISSDITVKALLDTYPQTLQMFLDMGLLCAGCPAESFHTLADVAKEYKIDVNTLVDNINKNIINNSSSL